MFKCTQICVSWCNMKCVFLPLVNVDTVDELQERPCRRVWRRKPRRLLLIVDLSGRLGGGRGTSSSLPELSESFKPCTDCRPSPLLQRKVWKFLYFFAPKPCATVGLKSLGIYSAKMGAGGCGGYDTQKVFTLYPVSH